MARAQKRPGATSARPRQHVGDDPRVAGHVDDADLEPARQAEVREAEVDRHPAPLLLREAIGVDAGEGSDQGRLAVINMAGRPDHEAHRATPLYATSTASMSVSSSPLKTVRASRQQASFSMRAI